MTKVNAWRSLDDEELKAALDRTNGHRPAGIQLENELPGELDKLAVLVAEIRTLCANPLNADGLQAIKGKLLEVSWAAEGSRNHVARLARVYSDK